MSENSELYFALLRISAAQALRAAGLTTCRPSVLDSFTDIFARYLMLLASATRDLHESRGSIEPDVSDVRAALEHVGLIRPLNLFNDPHGNDTRGVDELIAWFKGPQAAEMRRVAGVGKEGELEIVGMTMLNQGVPVHGRRSGSVAGVGILNNLPKTLLVGAKMVNGNGTGIRTGDGDGQGRGEGQVTAQTQIQGTQVQTEEFSRDECSIRWFHDLKGKPERLRGTALGPSMNGCRPITIEGGMINLDLVKPQLQVTRHREDQSSITVKEEQEEEQLLQEDTQLKEEDYQSNSESLSPPPADMDLSLTPGVPAPSLGEVMQEN